MPTQLPDEHTMGDAQSAEVEQLVLHPLASHPIGQAWEVGATHDPLMHVLCPVNMLPAHVGPDPQFPVGKLHAPLAAPVHIPAQVPVPHDLPPTGAPDATGRHFPRFPA